MNRTPLDALLTRKALDRVALSGGHDLADMLLEGRLQVEGGIETKNVCAKVLPDLAAKIDEVCDLLDIPKRRFLEAAMIEAVNFAWSVIHEEGVLEAMDDSRCSEEGEAAMGSGE